MSSENEISLFKEQKTFFVDLILPVPIPNLYTYRLTREQAAVVGARAIVEFGKSRIVTGIISAIHETPPLKYKPKYVLEVLDQEPIITKNQLWLFSWIAEYYASPIGLVMNVALPSGLKVSSESNIELNADFSTDNLLEPEELFFLEIIAKKGSITMVEASDFFGKSKVSRSLKNLIAKRAIIIYEKINEKYRPKTEKRFRVESTYANADLVLELIDTLSDKQQEVILSYLKLMPLAQLSNRNSDGVPLAKLKELGCSMSSIKTLEKNKIVETFTINVSRFATDHSLPIKTFNLSEKQKQASKEIFESFENHQVVLFHGITGSGKTEVYIDLIQQVLASGSQVLLLLPEIALTTQMVLRLQKVFGDSMGVYHSKFSDNERVEVYKGVLEGKFSFVIGVRSSIFLPFTDLGLIIVDEEHESSYKQMEPAPRYHARDTAIMMAHKFGAKVLLGSATPSVESYFMAKNGKYGLVELFSRYGKATLPQFIIANAKLGRKQKTNSGSFTKELIEGIKTRLEKKEQVIIFQNRRGYSPYLNCEECNYIPKCNQCSVSLTYHMFSNTLVCHYCGYKEQVPKECPACGTNKIITVGDGTEKIEDELKLFFPEATIKRMDYDTTRTKTGYADLIQEFSSGQIDILVGTQMLSKGLDFENVSLVGVFDADKILNFPDFRANEKAFQLITQVSGRSGRKNSEGQVVIQTGEPDNRVLKQIIDNNYQAFYEDEIVERKAYNYPPFSRLIKLSIKHIEDVIAKKAARKIANSLGNIIGAHRVLGPEKAIIERVRNKYIYEVYLKLEKNKVNSKAFKTVIKEEVTNLVSEKDFKKVTIIINVDSI